MTTSYICALLFQSIFEAIRERMGVEVWMKKKKREKGKQRIGLEKCKKHRQGGTWGRGLSKAFVVCLMML